MRKKRALLVIIRTLLSLIQCFTKLPILNLLNFIPCLLLLLLLLSLFFSSQPHYISPLYIPSLLSLFIRYSLFNISFFHFFFSILLNTANVQVFVKVYGLFLILGYALDFDVKLKQAWSAWKQL